MELDSGEQGTRRGTAACATQACAGTCEWFPCDCGCLRDAACVCSSEGIRTTYVVPASSGNTPTLQAFIPDCLRAVVCKLAARPLCTCVVCLETLALHEVALHAVTLHAVALHAAALHEVALHEAACRLRLEIGLGS